MANINGTVTLSTLETPGAATVLLLNEAGDTIVATTTSNATTGAYSFTGIPAGTYRPLVLGAAAYRSRAFGPCVAIETDPNWANVSSLLHFDGANGSTTFTDEKGLAWTPASNAKIDTGISKFGGASGLFDGVADNITTPATAAMGFGSGDYTVEGWLYQANEAADRCIFDNRNASTEGIAIYSSAAGVDNVRRLLLTSNTAIIAGTGSTQFPVNTWSHWAVCRSGSTVRGFIDGAQVWSVTDARTLASSAPAIIGANYTTGQEFVGRLDEMRVTKGIARYTANFTPPTAAFPNS